MTTALLKILILGGTHFLGIHLTEELQERGHEVTLFNRGIQNPNLFPNIERLQGDRDGDLRVLVGRHWDVVIDTSGHIPRLVAQSAEVLRGATHHYIFISTIGVYDNFYHFNLDESYPLAQLEDPDSEIITDKTYGALKGLCEAVVQQRFPKQTLIIRPGLIVGPHDPTDRFTYWIRRMAEGGEILVPANQPLQFIDVRDLSKWIADMVENQTTGIYNATGVSSSFEQLLQECQQISAKKTHITWVSEDFLLKKHIQDWVELPLWLSSKRQMPGFSHINSEKAIKAGLTFRPLIETIAATLKWDTDRGPVKLHAGLERSKERNLLLDWKMGSVSHFLEEAE